MDALMTEPEHVVAWLIQIIRKKNVTTAILI